MAPPFLAEIRRLALATVFVGVLVACANAETVRCAVCGMNPAQFARWRASAVLADGGRVEFESPKCLFRFLSDPTKHRGGARVASNGAVRVVEYYSQRPTDARPLHYVAGSDVPGPMGTDYVPVRGLDKAREFLADHAGREILTFEQAVRRPP